MTSTDLVPVSQRSSFDLLPQAHELATAIAKTEFVPKDLRNRPEAIMACVLAGHEIGIGPMQSLSKICIIEGKPGMYAELMRALILARGHEFWFEEKSSTKVTACGRRAGSDRVSTVTWTMDDAQKAGLAGKQNYRKIPRQMLTARATAELARDVFADVIGGLAAVEELEDGYDFDAEPVAETAEKPPPVRRARRAAKKAAAPKTAAPAVNTGPPPAPLLPNEVIDADVVDAEIVEDEPDPAIAAAPTVKDIAVQAQDVFSAEYDAAPRGQKTKVADRLRHAAVYAATKERVASTAECTPDERFRVARLLDDIAAGHITYTADALNPTAGVTFTLKRPDHPDGDKDVTVLWAELGAEEASR